MKMSLLDMVIDIMSDMDSDNVSAIGDSGESTQVARIIRSVYFEMIARKDWPHLRKSLYLENSGTSTIPNRLKLPTAISRLDYFAYSDRKEATSDQRFKEMKYLFPDQFLERTNNRATSNDNVDSVIIADMTMFVLNDKPPTYYTSFDDEWLILDSYVKDLSTTLTGNQAQCVAFAQPEWTHADTFVPDFPTEVFPTFLAEAKSACFARIKEQEDRKSEQQAARGNIAMAQRGFKIQGGIRYGNFGRGSRKGGGGGNNFNPNQFSG